MPEAARQQGTAVVCFALLEPLFRFLFPLSSFLFPSSHFNFLVTFTINIIIFRHSIAFPAIPCLFLGYLPFAFLCSPGRPRRYPIMAHRRGLSVALGPTRDPRTSGLAPFQGLPYPTK